MTTGDSVLRKVEKMKYGVWSHTECEYVTAHVYRAYDRMQQRNHTLNAVEGYHVVRRKEMRVHKMEEEEGEGEGGGGGRRRRTGTGTRSKKI
jgi:hypothetical protein